jgi:hypothetical protein
MGKVEMSEEITLQPIGTIVRDEQVILRIDGPYRPALAHLADF